MHKSVWKATYLTDDNGNLWEGTGDWARGVRKGTVDLLDFFSVSVFP